MNTPAVVSLTSEGNTICGRLDKIQSCPKYLVKLSFGNFPFAGHVRSRSMDPKRLRKLLETGPSKGTGTLNAINLPTLNLPMKPLRKMTLKLLQCLSQSYKEPHFSSAV